MPATALIDISAIYKTVIKYFFSTSGRGVHNAYQFQERFIHTKNLDLGTTLLEPSVHNAIYHLRKLSMTNDINLYIHL